MARGLDANHDVSASAARLKAAGYDFVARYYKFTPGSHGLTRVEAAALSAAGLSVVAVFENGSPTEAAYFSLSAGFRDGEMAYRHARHVIEQPPGSPIYFAVDFDAAAPEVEGPVAGYFRGVLAAFHQEAKGEPAYAIGVYGSGAACGWLKRHTAVSYAWLAASAGWRGSRSFAGWNLRQTAVEQHVFGLLVDLDESRGHGGGFRVGRCG